MKWQDIFLGFVLVTDFSLGPVRVLLMASDEHPDLGHDQDVHPSIHLETNSDISDVNMDTNVNDNPGMNKDNYEDADWHPPNSIVEAHVDLTPEAPWLIRSKNTSFNDTTNQDSTQTTSSSSLQCSDHNSNLASEGQCQLMGTMGESQNGCLDIFRCTDYISHWFQENQNIKEQLKDLTEMMSDLQEELRNHRHQVKVLEMQGEERVRLKVNFDERLGSVEQRHVEAKTLLHVHAALLQQLQVQLHDPVATEQLTGPGKGYRLKDNKSSLPRGIHDQMPPDGLFFSFCLSDCASLYHNGVRRSGVYTVVLFPGVSLPVYCDMETEGGGWTVFQRRKDGSVNFNRGWCEYRDGFGETQGEHWLGNQHLHLLSNQGHHSLCIHLHDWSHTHKHALYHTFRVDDEENHYRLHVSGFSGTVEDSFGWYHNQHVFSTPDTGNICAEICHSGWWFHECFYANLNGVYYKVPHNGSCKPQNYEKGFMSLCYNESGKIQNLSIPLLPSPTRSVTMHTTNLSVLLFCHLLSSKLKRNSRVCSSFIGFCSLLQL